MTLFSSDLYRNFGFGFFAGTMVIGFSNGTEIVTALAAVAL